MSEIDDARRALHSELLSLQVDANAEALTATAILTGIEIFARAIAREEIAKGLNTTQIPGSKEPARIDAELPIGFNPEFLTEDVEGPKEK